MKMNTSKQFYKKFGRQGLERMKSKRRTIKEVIYLKKLLNKKQRILDLACGYGRLTIPLAKQKYNIEGLDISPNLLRKAKQEAKKEKIKIKFRKGDMKKLPYKNKSYDVILCMWSSFMELSNKKDQLKAIREMLRILSNQGFVLIELPPPILVLATWKKESKEKFYFNPKTRFIRGSFEGVDSMPSYLHTKNTLKRLMNESKIKKYKIFKKKFGEVERIFLQFWNIKNE